MKKFLFLISFFAVIAVGVLVSISLLSNNTSEVKILSGLSQFSTPQQFYGMTVDMSQILPESQHYVKNSKGQDLIDTASSLGMNTFRITNITSPSDSLTPSYNHAQWEEVLGKMKSKNMYAVILIEANAGDAKFNRVTLDNYYLNFVKSYVDNANFCSFSNVIAIDIANEPILNANNLSKMEQAAQIVKQSCPSLKITIGSWGTDSGQKDDSGQPIYYWHDPKEMPRLYNIVDIYSVHMYGFDKPLNGPFPDPYTFATNYLNLATKYSNHKPVFIEEFGAGNGDQLTDQNTLGSQTLQKSVYTGLLKAMYDFRNKGVLGATGYLFYPRSDGPDSWSIAKDNANTLLPAAYTFQNFQK